MTRRVLILVMLICLACVSCFAFAGWSTAPLAEKTILYFHYGHRRVEMEKLAVVKWTSRQVVISNGEMLALDHRYRQAVRAIFVLPVTVMLVLMMFAGLKHLRKDLYDEFVATLR